jgi:hypothetical protein
LSDSRKQELQDAIEGYRDQLLTSQTSRSQDEPTVVLEEDRTRSYDEGHEGELFDQHDTYAQESFDSSTSEENESQGSVADIRDLESNLSNDEVRDFFVLLCSMIEFF